ncbi:MAG: hypothetical protein H7Y22_04010, partial [Gemmatimonadaceae bacterium]|nr:hypothetical protein [Gloeobacterales cyanobacterium ES-bin-141]
LICALETGGNISPKQAYDEIRDLWKKLKASKHNLLDNPLPPASPEPEV